MTVSFCTVFNTKFEKLCDCLLLFRFNTFVNIDFKHIPILCFYLMMLDGFLANNCIYIFWSLNKINQHETSRDFTFIDSTYSFATLLFSASLKNMN